MASERVEQALERLGEDGTLTGNVTDAAAEALLRWAERQIVAADAVADDAVFARRVSAIRAAVRAAAQAEDEAAPVTVRAEQALGAGTAEVSHAVGVSRAATEMLSPRPPQPGRSRRRIRLWTYRKAL